MSDWLDEFRGKRTGVVAIPTIWVAIALSLAIHVAVLWEWLPRLHLPSSQDVDLGERSLVVRLAPPPSAAPAPAAPPALRTPPSPTLESRPPKPAPRPRAIPPPVIALERPAPDIASPSVAAPAQRPPADGDLASYVEARRRARAESAPAAAADSASNAPPVEDDKARANRLAAANLAFQRPLTFGYDPARGGGIFSIQRMGYDNAEFMFYGWNKDIARNTAQLIEVRRGGNSDIRVAVIRRMIAIIRDYEQEDFIWESKRLGRNLTLSARARDNAGLEDFMMREFFDDPLRPQ